MFPTCYGFYLRIPAGTNVFDIPNFNILDAMKHPSEDHSIYHIDIIDDAIETYFLFLPFALHEICMCFNCLNLHALVLTLIHIVLRIVILMLILSLTL